jgi:hypothetical protein
LHILKNLWFLKKSASFEHFVFFVPKEGFTNAKKYIFVISSSDSIKWCKKTWKKIFYLIFALPAPYKIYERHRKHCAERKEILQWEKK